MKLALSVGTSRHYRIIDITDRHFLQTGEAAKLQKSLVRDALEEMADTVEQAIGTTESAWHQDFPGPSTHQLRRR